MTNTKKALFALTVVSVFVMSVALLPANVSFAAVTKAKPIKVVGMAKFVFQGTVLSLTANSLTLHIANTSTNAKQLFDGKDKTLTIGAKTVVTKNGKNISLSKVKVGDKIRVFGIFDKKTGAISVVRWIKVVSR